VVAKRPIHHARRTDFLAICHVRTRESPGVTVAKAQELGFTESMLAKDVERGALKIA
jgi:hypothetical protein